MTRVLNFTAEVTSANNWRYPEQMNVAIYLDSIVIYESVQSFNGPDAEETAISATVMGLADKLAKVLNA